jgi:hypothetical protein
VLIGNRPSCVDIVDHLIFEPVRPESGAALTNFRRIWGEPRHHSRTGFAQREPDRPSLIVIRQKSDVADDKPVAGARGTILAMLLCIKLPGFAGIVTKSPAPCVL